MSRVQRSWFNHFKSGRTLIGEDPRSGQPSMSTNDDNTNTIHAMFVWLSERLMRNEHQYRIMKGNCNESNISTNLFNFQTSLSLIMKYIFLHEHLPLWSLKTLTNQNLQITYSPGLLLESTLSTIGNGYFGV